MIDTYNKVILNYYFLYLLISLVLKDSKQYLSFN